MLIFYRLDNPENRVFDVGLSLSGDGGRTFALYPKALGGDFSWICSADDLRAAYRPWFAPAYRSNVVGLRPAR
ncbi:MAG: hypothetical protein HY927_07690 [Elusimicrobia bacterium]|nr:hypothetical protein [Elusimicrobiota bacterium]